MICSNDVAGSTQYKQGLFAAGGLFMMPLFHPEKDRSLACGICYLGSSLTCKFGPYLRPEHRIEVSRGLVVLALV
jgi:hypothetical protein